MRLVDFIKTELSLIRRGRLFKQQFYDFCKMTKSGAKRPVPAWDDRYPCLDDETSTTGFDRHYIYHPAWAARVLATTRPDKHVDISSTLHFCSIVSAFVPVCFYDFRPAPLVLPGLESRSADITRLDWPTNSVNSLSCMHVLEHIGLGRYGDPLDPDGDLKAIEELVRVLAPGGTLLVAVPVGNERVCFNAHRVYDAKKFATFFIGLDLVEFALIPDGEAKDGLIFQDALNQASLQSYGCGCFWFKKPRN